MSELMATVYLYSDGYFGDASDRRSTPCLLLFQHLLLQTSQNLRLVLDEQFLLFWRKFRHLLLQLLLDSRRQLDLRDLNL